MLKEGDGQYHSGSPSWAARHGNVLRGPPAFVSLLAVGGNDKQQLRPCPRAGCAVSPVHVAPAVNQVYSGKFEFVSSSQIAECTGMTRTQHSARTFPVEPAGLHVNQIARPQGPLLRSTAANITSMLSGMIVKQSVYCMMLLSTMVRSSLSQAVGQSTHADAARSIYWIARGGFFMEHLMLTTRAANSAAEFEAMSSNIIFIELSNVARIIKAAAEKLDSGAKEFLGRYVLDVYVPIARRFRFSTIVQTLEEKAIELLDPVGFDLIRALVASKANEGERILHSVQEKLKSSVSMSPKASNVSISSRVKTPSSVYLKMKAKGKNFSEIRDLFAVRMVVRPAVQDAALASDACHTLLTKLRETYSVSEEYTKDYITFPKANGYRGLHTVVDHDDVQVEVQIRTEAMHETAENGSAAHWQYKSASVALAVG
eukprot:CAMPEP_0198730432 /NCGR_PEP_ID=MMETSP1475-20131203/24563_1 /TAXON_ID= ORGANISM="Unidentified sp., Strain CCMP1999" /NCGR_SAMPLE_ID=MMETSP1475 /ASSEMBLY_ACC=CAM_ASM_001111 /LENGTH=427 /DNA_ID=CAMNT_0044493237 /DNA_START=271 /DNA_END=1551 /DNA_ORIENTATION=-